MRLGTHMVDDLRLPESFVHAADVKGARRGLGWMLPNDPSMGFAVFVETMDGLDWIKLQGDEIEKFVRHGTTPGSDRRMTCRP